MRYKMGEAPPTPPGKGPGYKSRYKEILDQLEPGTDQYVSLPLDEAPENSNKHFYSGFHTTANRYGMKVLTRVMRQTNEFRVWRLT